MSYPGTSPSRRIEVPRHIELFFGPQQASILLLPWLTIGAQGGLGEKRKEKSPAASTGRVGAAASAATLVVNCVATQREGLGKMLEPLVKVPSAVTEAATRNGDEEISESGAKPALT